MLSVNQLVDVLITLGSTKSESELKKTITELCLYKKTGVIDDWAVFTFIIKKEDQLAEKCKKLNIYDLIGLEAYSISHSQAQAHNYYKTLYRKHKR